ncbi:MAG: UvrD-helicase domain-containing protein [Erysipelotrichaceae bacterium]|nr:UvrD-helicase domain-containing protein [Erysipelotrichaceae bacterium]
MPTWNKQQQKAIYTKKKNIVVSASAGSGKTTVLIARLIDLVLKDRISIENILAMTFSEAAANEMKKRLASELHKLLETTQDQEERDYISQQLTNIQTAYISTIHSFCLSIVQKYYYCIGLDAKRVQNILDASVASLYQQEAMQIALQKQFTSYDSIFHELSSMFSSKPHDYQELSKMVQALASLASSQPDSDKWLQKAIESYTNTTSIQDYPPLIMAYFFDYLTTQTCRYHSLLQQLRDILVYRYEDQDKKINQLDKKITAFPSLEEALQQKDYMQFKTAFIAICHLIPPTSPSEKDEFCKSIRKQIIDLEDMLVGQLFDASSFIKDNQYLQPYITRFIAICKDYKEAYASIKQREKVIDFDDMEHFALAILQANNGAIAKQYQELFIEIMVDEFQDSNDVQNALIQLICRENNVFRVGDIKQSIYGFRHAKPQLMRGLMENQGPMDEVIYLSNNYRSKKMIVDFNNILFKNLMNTEGFDCHYTKEDDVETGIPAQLEDNMPIVFHAINEQQIAEETNSIFSKDQWKASYISNQIMQMKQLEKKNWKDFVVLVRNNAQKDILKEAFDELQIPYFIDIKHGFYQSNAVQVILSFLKACLSPHDNLSFVAMLSSPFIRLSFEELAHAKLHKQTNESYYTYFQQHPFTEFEKIQEFIQLIHTLPLSTMLNKLYDYQNFYHQHTTLQEKTNLDLLFEKAVRFEQSEGMGTIAFLNHIEHLKSVQTAQAIPIGGEADVVRVMSIHQSKGLQFPVVFLLSNTSQAQKTLHDFMLFDDELGVSMKAMDFPQRFVRTSIQRIAMEHKKNREELEEEMRILYVATTRAQQQMHIVDCIKKLDLYEKQLSMTSIYERGGYSSWILQTFLQEEHPLFQIKKIDTMWKQQIHQTQSAPLYELTSYKQPWEPWKITTASKTKESHSSKHLDLHPPTLFTRGIALHKLIEQLGKLPWDKEHIQQIATQINYELTPRDISALQHLANNPLYQQAQTYSSLYHELPYMVNDQDEILHGFMDFVAIQDNECIIIDFKTDYVETEEILKERYADQMLTYKQAMHILYPDINIQTFLYSLHFHKEIKI